MSHRALALLPYLYFFTTFFVVVFCLKTCIAFAIFDALVFLYFSRLAIHFFNTNKLVAIVRVEFILEEFVKQPCLEVFHKCTKDNLTYIADHYSIIVSKTKAKKVIKHELWNALFEKGMLPDPGMAVLPTKQAFPDQSIRKLELELELRRLELQDKASEREAAARLKEQEFKFKQMEIGRAD